MTTKLTDPTARIRRAGPVDVPDLADVLAAAFDTDPAFAWMMPHRARRRELTPGLFRIVLDATVGFGEVYAVDIDAVAIWLPPGAALDEESSSALLEGAAENAPRVASALRLLAEIHPADPHADLFLLATTPARQSGGLGSALLRHVLDVCDRDRTPAYLEATSERNRALYLRHGFADTPTVHLPEGPPLWPMWRDPRLTLTPTYREEYR
jgi:GNAT superfamily N-acetyltransferase